MANARERAREADLLRFGLGEIETVAPQPGEDGSLADEEQRLGHADTLRTAAHAAELDDVAAQAVAFLAPSRAAVARDDSLGKAGPFAAAPNSAVVIGDRSARTPASSKMVRANSCQEHDPALVRW